MPVKRESRVKSQESRKKIPTTSLRTTVKQSQKKIATVRHKVGPRNDKMSVPVYSLAGRASGKLTLPKEIFGQKVNEKLLSQAVRVYMTNQKTLPGSTKTRGEVVGSTAKVWRQKGTGRARHGAITAPIFVGGGIAFGPKPRKVRLDLPKKMKKAALISALSAKAKDKGILGISGIEKASGKTKEIIKLLSAISRQISDKHQNKVSALIMTGEKIDNIVRATKNIPSVTTLTVSMINAYEVIKHDLLLLTKDTVDKLSNPKKETK